LAWLRFGRASSRRRTSTSSARIAPPRGSPSGCVRKPLTHRTDGLGRFVVDVCDSGDSPGSTGSGGRDDLPAACDRAAPVFPGAPPRDGCAAFLLGCLFLALMAITLGAPGVLIAIAVALSYRPAAKPGSGRAPHAMSEPPNRRSAAGVCVVRGCARSLCHAGRRARRRGCRRAAARPLLRRR